MNNRINVGIIGAGFAGTKLHASALVERHVDSFRVRAFSDIDGDRLKAACDLYEAKGYSRVEELFADPEVDLVVVATRPHTSHAELAIQAMQAGKHVVVEKPMCLTSAEAENMIAVRDQTQRVLTVFQIRRWDMDYLNLRQVWEDQRVGEPRVLKSFYPASAGRSDVLYDWGSHLIDQVLTLLGDVPRTVIGTLAYPEESRDRLGYFSSVLIYPNNMTVEIAALPQPKPFILPRFYLAGTDASLVHDWVERPEDGMFKHMAYKSREGGVQFEFMQPRYYSHAETNIPTFYQNLHDALTDRVPLSVKPEEALKTVKVTEAIIQSAKSHQTPVALDQLRKSR